MSLLSILHFEENDARSPCIGADYFCPSSVFGRLVLRIIGIFDFPPGAARFGWQCGFAAEMRQVSITSSLSSVLSVSVSGTTFYSRFVIQSTESATSPRLRTTTIFPPQFIILNQLSDSSSNKSSDSESHGHIDSPPRTQTKIVPPMKFMPLQPETNTPQHRTQPKPPWDERNERDD